HLARHIVAGLEIETLDLRLRNVDVFVTRQVTLGAQKAFTIGQDLEEALLEQVAGSLGLRLEDAKYQVGLLHGGRDLNVEVFGEVAQLRRVHLFERSKVEVVTPPHHVALHHAPAFAIAALTPAFAPGLPTRHIAAQRVVATEV